MLEIKGSKATATIKTPHGARLLLTGEVKLDETASPRRLDWIKFTGADQQEFPPLLGIYGLKGDRFTVCNGGLNGSRPSDFKPGNGILAEVVVFEREPSLAAAKSKPAASSERNRQEIDASVLGTGPRPPPLSSTIGRQDASTATDPTAEAPNTKSTSIHSHSRTCPPQFEASSPRVPKILYKLGQVSRRES